ncbi:MAG: hypothetical protein JNL34_00375 [Anaerolineae bacterium]|nr:hypothetical protein [Anaerolineae bacterium]
MRFTLYTDKTVAQCLTAINARMQAKETATRPALDGWIDRNGEFALKVTRPVIGKYRRTTRLKGHIEREAGMTVVRGIVPGGSGPRERIVGLGALAVMGGLIALTGQPLLAMLLIPVAFWLYITMVGDYENGPLLLSEVQRALKAKATPPKPGKNAATPAPKSASAARSVTRTPASAKAARPPAAKPALTPDDDDEDDEEDAFEVDEDAQPRMF